MTKKSGQSKAASVKLVKNIHRKTRQMYPVQEIILLKAVNPT